MSVPAASLPERAAVAWRAPADARRIDARGRAWTATTVAHAVPFVVAAGLLFALEPLTFPLGLILLAHAWVIPELYAKRGANVLSRRVRGTPHAESTALGLLGDLVGHDARRVLADTGLLLERGRLGTWVLGPWGAVLVRERTGRAHAYCVGVEDPDLPPSDRIAHLLLALRANEEDFATVANLAYSGALWRLRRRLPDPARRALDAARIAVRGGRRR